MFSNKGFTLVEVLIASLILFFVIVTLSSGFKQYAAYRAKQKKYEDIYISVLSLKNKLEDENLANVVDREGEINGLHYEIAIKEVARKRSFVYGETKDTTGNLGKFQIVLYKVIIKIRGKEFTFFKTQYF